MRAVEVVEIDQRGRHEHTVTAEEIRARHPGNLEIAGEADERETCRRVLPVGVQRELQRISRGDPLRAQRLPACDRQHRWHGVAAVPLHRFTDRRAARPTGVTEGGTESEPVRPPPGEPVGAGHPRATPQPARRHTGGGWLIDHCCQQTQPGIDEILDGHDALPLPTLIATPARWVPMSRVAEVSSSICAAVPMVNRTRRVPVCPDPTRTVCSQARVVVVV